jgi:hypothetical protein
MHPYARLLVLCLCIPAYSIALAQSSAPTIEERMSREEFAAAGLDRLSPEQLKFLNEWIGTKGVSASVVPIKKRDGSLAFHVDESAREVVESRISGEFNGWTGKTVVTLDNGQKWQQTESGNRGARLANPAVTIKPMSMGSWLMIVKSCNCSMRVKRIG